MNVNISPPSFNLWFEPWIDVETDAGELEKVGFEKLFLEATEYRAFFDT